MILQNELILPCGAKLPNRLAKSAMSENLSPKHHGPTNELIQLYDRWSSSGAGLLITGNVMIDRKAIAEPGNVLVEDKSNFKALQKWAAVVKNTKTHLWPQINHPGRQAIGLINKEVVAPSAVKTKLKGLSSMFKKPKALTEDQIFDIIDRFGNTALILKQAGFSGVQIHAAHGYLISQFLSPLTNLRKDQWGGGLHNRSRFVVEVLRDMRRKVGLHFPIGIKINSADFQRGGFTEDESMEVVKVLDSEGIDLIEISGGNYESPAMTGSQKKESTNLREAYFLDYVVKVRQFLKAPLMLTGGFRTISAMERAVKEAALDVIGLARPFTLYPNLPNLIFQDKLTLVDVPKPKTGIKMFDNTGFVDIKWHEVHIHRLAKGKEPKFNLSAYAALRQNISLTMAKLIFGR